MTYHSELERVMVAWWWRMLPDAFRQLPNDQQAEMIAAYRIKYQIEAVVAAKPAPTPPSKPKTGRKGRT